MEWCVHLFLVRMFFKVLRTVKIRNGKDPTYNTLAAQICVSVALKTLRWARQMDHR